MDRPDTYLCMICGALMTLLESLEGDGVCTECIRERKQPKKEKEKESDRNTTTNSR
jgi:hypothetical protein